MLNRWNSRIEDINLLLKTAKIFVRCVMPNKRGRGRPPKRPLENYAVLIIAKEEDKKSLRKAERRLSQLICNERVDHSVIAYWEKQIATTKWLQLVMRALGVKLKQLLGYQFSVIDATDMTDWYGKLTTFHVVNRICDETVYPVGISFLTGSVRAPVNEATPDGKGKMYADAGYDDNRSIGVLFRKNYEPIVCPVKTRYKGYHRRKARKLYKMPENRLGYRQRGRGESIFGTMTNTFGDRLPVRDKQVMQTRLTAKVIAIQLKLVLRASAIWLILIRHAPESVVYEN
jgi:hypothetical protein